MKTKYLVILLFSILFSGCTQQKGSYGDLLIDVSYPDNIRYGRDFTITIYLENGFNRDVKNVLINLENIDILNFKKIEKCEGKILDKGCLIEKLEPGDGQEVVFLFNVPKEIYIPGKDVSIEPKIITSYDFDGQTIINIPITGEKYKENKNFQKFITNGPIMVDVSLSDMEDGNSIRSDSIFDMRVNIQSPEKENVLKKDDFVIKLEKIHVYDSGDADNNCDFNIISTNQDYQLLGLKEDYYFSNERELQCWLETSSIDPDKWDYGKITIDYNYNYKMFHNLIIQLSR